jgi:hypothetical protein
MAQILSWFGRERLVSVSFAGGEGDAYLCGEHSGRVACWWYPPPPICDGRIDFNAAVLTTTPPPSPMSDGRIDLAGEFCLL